MICLTCTLTLYQWSLKVFQGYVVDNCNLDHNIPINEKFSNLLADQIVTGIDIVLEKKEQS